LLTIRHISSIFVDKQNVAMVRGFAVTSDKF